MGTRRATVRHLGGMPPSCRLRIDVAGEARTRGFAAPAFAGCAFVARMLGVGDTVPLGNDVVNRSCHRTRSSRRSSLAPLRPRCALQLERLAEMPNPQHLAKRFAQRCIQRLQSPLACALGQRRPRPRDAAPPRPSTRSAPARHISRRCPPPSPGVRPSPAGPPVRPAQERSASLGSQDAQERSADPRCAGTARPLDRQVDARHLRRFHSANRGSGAGRSTGDARGGGAGGSTRMRGVYVQLTSIGGCRAGAVA